MGELIAARAAGRMGAGQQYRTMARMLRRRSEAPAPPAQPDYTVELERLAQLRDQGVITAEDFEAKKNQLLGL